MNTANTLWSRSPAAGSLLVEQALDHIGAELFVTEWRRVDRAHLDSFHWSVDSTPEASNTAGNAAFPRGADNIDGVMLVALVQAAFFNNYPFWTDGWVTFNYGFDRVRFPRTVYLEDQLRLRATLSDATRKGDGVLMRNAVTIEVLDAERPAMAAEFLVFCAPLG